jgi:hypothetical protein
VTYKALLEMAALEPEVSPDEVRQLLEGLNRSSFRHRVRSARSGEWLYVFRATWCGEHVYIKLLLRADCTIVSFHPEASDDELEEDTNAPG